MIKKVINIAIVCIIMFRVTWVLYDNRAKFVPDYWQRYPILKDVFGQSQYMMKGWKYWIPDETAYSYAAGAYAKGANPILVESTQPPLGKYIIGLSIVLTGNENILVAVFFMFLLLGVYILAIQLTGRIFLGLMATLFTSFERLFTDQLSFTPLLDIFFITFVVYGLIAASCALQRRKPAFLLVSYACFGASLMVKVWLIGIVFVLPMTAYILLRNRSYYLFVIGGFFLMLLITFLSYTRMFMDGYNIIEVLKVQKWLYWYQGGKQNRLFTIWPLIFLNRWYVWWGETPISKDPNWSFSWPVVIGSGILASIRMLTMSIKTAKPVSHLCGLSVLSYAVFMSLGQPSARYLLPILPICYPISAWIVLQLVSRIRILRVVL